MKQTKEWKNVRGFRMLQVIVDGKQVDIIRYLNQQIIEKYEKDRDAVLEKGKDKRRIRVGAK